jgi:hypothetical protein
MQNRAACSVFLPKGFRAPTSTEPVTFLRRIGEMEIYLLPQRSVDLDFECVITSEKFFVWVKAWPTQLEFAEGFNAKEHEEFPLEEILDFFQEEWKLKFPAIPPPTSSRKHYMPPYCLEQPPNRAICQLKAGEYTIYVLPPPPPVDSHVTPKLPPLEFEFVLQNSDMWALLAADDFEIKCPVEFSSLDVDFKISYIKDLETIKNVLIDHMCVRKHVVRQMTSISMNEIISKQKSADVTSNLRNRRSE